jgi:flagellar biosynthesis protein
MKEKQKKAAALRYNPPEDSAPKLVAKGRGTVAEKILLLAKEHGVPIKEDTCLTEALSALDIYQEIPPDLYKAVAHILAFIYKMTNKKSS